MSVPEETWPLGYMVRARTYAADLVKELDAEDCGTSTRVLVSHAASVALIAALLGVQLETTLKFAPTGAYVLARDASAPRHPIRATKHHRRAATHETGARRSATHARVLAFLGGRRIGKRQKPARFRGKRRWTLLRSGASNEPYVTENSATTYPWGYKPNYLEAWANDHAGKRFPEA